MAKMTKNDVAEFILWSIKLVDNSRDPGIQSKLEEFGWPGLHPLKSVGLSRQEFNFSLRNGQDFTGKVMIPRKK